MRVCLKFKSLIWRTPVLLEKRHGQPWWFGMNSCSGYDSGMNYEVYSAALRIIELMKNDSSLCGKASDYGDWYNNLLEHICDFESENLEMCLVLRALRKEMSDHSS
ncbi:hypothetical protein N9026_00315 [bacterium]|nr:hypothetical protein [bacterium]